MRRKGSIWDVSAGEKNPTQLAVLSLDNCPLEDPIVHVNEGYVSLWAQWRFPCLLP